MEKIFEELLRKLGVTPKFLEQARKRQVEQGGFIREHLIALGAFTEEAFATIVSAQLRVPYVNLQNITIADDVLALLPREKAEKYIALPLELDQRHRRLTIAMSDPSNMSALDELKFVVGYTLIPHYTPQDELLDAIQREYTRFESRQIVAPVRIGQPAVPEVQTRIIEVASLTTAEAPISRLLGSFFTLAYAKRASEIHIEPLVDGVRICFRVDGKILKLAQLPKKITSTLIARIKRLFGLEVREHPQAFQRGFATLHLQDKKSLDISYFMYPTIQNEKVVIKIKDKHALPLPEQFDLAPKPHNDLRQSLQAAYGIVFITGIARSGITTTLYALLHAMNTPHTNIITVEDPIECAMDGVTQGQISEESGHTYDQYIKNILKQQPDVAMVDKVSDPRRVQDILKLSSGTFVLSSFSAVDTANAVVKLSLMSNPKLVADRVTCMVSQRLVRKICESCKEEVPLADTYREKLGLLAEDLCYAGKGCDACSYTGYKGLIPIFEVMPLTEPIKQAITKLCAVQEIRTLNENMGVLSLRDDGMRKVRRGITTVQEVLKATIL